MNIIGQVIGVHYFASYIFVFIHISGSKVDVERRLDTFRQSVEHTNEKLTELTSVYDDVQVCNIVIYLYASKTILIIEIDINFINR